MKRKSYIAKVLIAISLVMLVMLQLLWLKREFQSGVEAFDRETNLVFRSTIQHITDSLIFSNLELSGLDTVQFQSVREMLRSMRRGEPGMNRGLRNLEMYRKNTENSPDKSDTVLHWNLQRPVEDDSIAQSGNDAPMQTQSGPMRYFSLFAIEAIDPEVLEAEFRQGLSEKLKRLDVNVLIKEAGERDFFQNSDSISFTTHFMRLGRKNLYAIEFPKGAKHVLNGILPQIGFSIVLTGLMVLSFTFLLNNMRAQEKLIVQKNTFISNVSHELKTPVATVSVALEALKNFNVLQQPEKTREYLQIAENEVKRLDLMVEKILKTTVFDTDGHQHIAFRPLDLAVLLRKITQTFYLLASKKNTEIQYQAENQVLVNGNEEYLELMIYNLIDNALKYGGNGSIIKLELFCDGPWAFLVVEDEGFGIAREYHEKIFDRFFRVPSGNVHDIKGYGLGLSFVAGVVKSHKGLVTLESAPGKGSKFTVKLPLYAGN
ncbi:MAG: HAMP domain-containing histidine kinase [Cyclobacteriaceae bacterium]|nr:HAMP domain-containing histidine kinase [Cyclobacteriaceae bacterium]